MAEQLKRRSALGDLFRTPINIPTPGLTITERHPLTMYDIGGKPEIPSAGCAIPHTPNTVSSNGDNRLLWLSPKRWLLVSPHPDVIVNATIKRDVSCGRTVLRLSGPNVRDVLAKGCPLDLHPHAFKTGCCAQSRISSLNVLLDHIDEETFDVYVARGFAVTFWDWLIGAAQEYGFHKS